MNRNSESALAGGRKRLLAAGIESYCLDALVLIAEASGRTKEWLLSHDYVLSEQEYDRYLSYIELREKQKPVQYIIGKCEFMGLIFNVDENVLIPRSDTELLAETVIEASRSGRPRILDLCTGSGCIAVSAAHYNPAAQITASDISAAAVSVAERNAASNGVSEKIKFCTGDLFEAFTNDAARFDIIASNPPYISESEMRKLPESVRSYEPLIALGGGVNGLAFYERIAEYAHEYLSEKGLLLLEIGYNQAEAVCGLLNKNGFNNINIYKDLAGYDRVIEGEMNV